MAKYSYEFKKRLVDAYLCGEGSYRYLCEKYDVVSHKDIRKWVELFLSSKIVTLLSKIFLKNSAFIPRSA